MLPERVESVAQMEWFIQHRVLHGAYRTKSDVPDEIRHLATLYEGSIPNCTGWNMPVRFVEKNATPTSPLRPYLAHAEYMIVYPTSDLQTKKHELLHALYAMNTSYRREVRALWDSLSLPQQQRIHHVLLRLGYSTGSTGSTGSTVSDYLLDEFQAYYYTEKPSFFGIDGAKRNSRDSRDSRSKFHRK